MDNQADKAKPLDDEWIELIQKARAQGLDVKEIRAFLQANRPLRSSASCKVHFGLSDQLRAWSTTVDEDHDQLSELKK